MTVRTPPLYIAASLHPAEDDRRGHAAIFGGRGGIVAPGDLAVSQNGTPNMTVLVATGQVVVPGTENTYQGAYLCENRGALSVSIAASDPTNPRRDLIVARVRDAEYSGATNSFAIEAITGTPAASPVDPAVPANSWVLARVQVDAAATSITSAKISDLRTTGAGQYGQAAALGGTIVCTSTTRPTSPFEGMRIYELDTDVEQTYTGSAWVPSAVLGAWPTFTPTLTQSGTVTKTVNEATYEKTGRSVIGSTHMTVTGAGTGGNAIAVGLPVAAKSFSGTPIIGTFWCYDASAGTGYHGALVLVSTTTAVGWATGQTGNIGVTPNFALASGDQVGHSFTYQAAS